MKQNRKELLTELTAHDCTCRACGVAYIGHGALCEEHETYSIRVIDDMVIAKRETADRAARKTRREWTEAV